ncbi:MAG: hypothetical protein U5R30_20555 [Deltaproteobacteria bacterium]|nr:hypothetical protein [Deltaproteobacteria bacterium]
MDFADLDFLYSGCRSNSSGVEVFIRNDRRRAVSLLCMAHQPDSESLDPFEPVQSPFFKELLLDEVQRFVDANVIFGRIVDGILQSCLFSEPENFVLASKTTSTSFEEALPSFL